MRLNTIKPAFGSKSAKKRVARGIGSGLGKTAGRGHKGQHSRSGGYHKVGFEGGQMPLQRRLPKVGFNSQLSLITTEVPLSALNKLQGDVVTVEALIASNIISAKFERVKIMLSGTIDKALTIKGTKTVKNSRGNEVVVDVVKVTKGAKAAIEAAGGKIED